MKKNKAMRTAAGLGIATLLTMSVISGSFAKYTTSNSGEDSARVAKWGFNQASTISLDNLFSSEYAKKNSTDKSKSVKASATNTDIIAPGTEGSASFGFTYDTNDNSVSAPEVAYNFEVSTEGSSIDSSIENNTNIVWLLDGAECKADTGNGKSSWDVLLENIAKLSGAESVTLDTNEVVGTVEYEPGKLPSAFYGTDSADGSKTHTVSWKWAFEKNTDGNKVDSSQDATDTAMGNAKSLGNVTLKITVTATQVD